jgi:hypothetical protein
LSVTKEVNKVFLVDKGQHRSHSATVNGTCTLTPFIRWVISCVWETSYVSMFCVLFSCLCSCVSVLVAKVKSWRQAATSGAGFDELKFKELGLIHHRLFWVSLPWWVMTGCLSSPHTIHPLTDLNKCSKNKAVNTLMPHIRPPRSHQ